jgi:signal transduction histidine kinase
MCTDKPVAVTADHPPAITAHGDPAYTRQILLNFVSNAARHTPSGHIVVALRRANGSVFAEVRDSGTGIAAEHLPRVFDRFYRAEASRSREHGGAGLGLAIARTLAHTQRARVGATSTEGAGSTFVLDLAADRSAWEARPIPGPSLPLA